MMAIVDTDWIAWRDQMRTELPQAFDDVTASRVAREFREVIAKKAFLAGKSAGRRTPQPVKPAGREVEPFGFVLIDKDGLNVWPDTFCVGEPRDDETDEAEWTPLYTHPPVADAALPAGMVLAPREPTREMCLAARHEMETYPIRDDANSPVVIYRAMIVALNQRGGGNG